jgi:hypothetical protein
MHAPTQASGAPNPANLRDTTLLSGDVDDTLWRHESLSAVWTVKRRGSSQIESSRKLVVHLIRWVRHGTGSVAKGEETRGTARLGLVGVDWKGFVVAPARVRNMVGTSSH